MFFSITPAPIFRGPPIQARSADVQAETAISKPVAIMKRRMSRCLALSSVEETRPRSDARADYAVSRENQNLEEKFLSVLQADPGRLLDTGEYSDFKVICGGREWRTHKAVLTRCDYFKKAITMGFRETFERKITIEGCSEIEIECLLRYIYTKDANLEKLRAASPSNSYLEACASLWFLGDYFALPALRDEAYELLARRCQRHHAESSRAVDALARGRGRGRERGGSGGRGGGGGGPLPFLPDLEAGVRAAWDPDRALAPLRAYLVTLCCLLHPYLGLHPTFAELLGDAPPAFAADFARALLGFAPGAAGARAPVDFAAETAERQLGGCAGCGRVITLTRTSDDDAGDEGTRGRGEGGEDDGDAAAAGPREVVRHGGVAVGKLVDLREEVGLVYHAPMSVGLFSSPGRLLCGVCARNGL